MITHAKRRAAKAAVATLARAAAPDSSTSSSSSSSGMITAGFGSSIPKSKSWYENSAASAFH